jgi:hypothetical protein
MQDSGNKTTNGWNEWSKYVLKELERLNDNYEALQKDFTQQIQEVKIEIATLKVKAGVWGLIAGAIPVAIALIIYILKL